MKKVFALFIAIISFQTFVFSQTNAQKDFVSTREMDRINWMEFKEVVPSRINTVLLPTGTLEPHGVVNNGADNTAPFAMAKHISRRTNALVAPTLPYGITGSMEAYPGAFQISESAYRPFVKQILEGLAKNGFRNIIILNGHGGGQTAVLQSVAAEVAAEKKVRTLVINWWSFASDVTKEVFGEDGGHAGWNETAFIQRLTRRSFGKSVTKTNWRPPIRPPERGRRFRFRRPSGFISRNKVTRNSTRKKPTNIFKKLLTKLQT